MKKKISFILVFLIMILMLACGKVEADTTATNYIDKPITAWTGEEAFWDSPDPYLADKYNKWDVGFYCFNHGERFNPYTINTQKNFFINKDGAISYSEYGDKTLTGRMHIENHQLYKISYVFGEVGNETRAEQITAKNIQYSVWKIMGATGIASKWEDNLSKKLYGESEAYYRYVKEAVKQNGVKLTSKDPTDNNMYYGPFQVTYSTGNYGNYTYKPTFNKIIINGTERTKVYTSNTGAGETAVNNMISGNNYYVKINEKAAKYTLKLKYTDIYSGWLSICDSTKNANNQALLAGKFSKVEKEIESTGQPTKVEINLHKVDANGNTINYESKFRIEAIQNNKTIYNQVVLGNSSCILEPEGGEPIYVTITETQAPAGYKSLNNPLNIIYIQNTDSSGTHYWASTYCPGAPGSNVNPWNNGDTFGGWTYNGNRNDPWPHTYYSKDNDKIVVTEKLYNGITTYDIYVYNDSNLPKISIDLQKYNSKGTTKLSGAEFKVTAMQDGTKIFEKDIKDSDKNCIVIPTSQSNIYVLIEETKAPNGYAKIKEPINIIYYLNGNKTAWNPTYTPDLEDIYLREQETEYRNWIEDLSNINDLDTLQAELREWNVSNNKTIDEWIEEKGGTQADNLLIDWHRYYPEYTYEIWLASRFSHYGEWSCISETTDANGNKTWPRTYQSASGDIIVVNETIDYDAGIENSTIKVYNDAIINVELLKVDATNNNLKLSGATFKGTISNVKGILGFEPDANGKISFSGLTTDDNGKIAFNDLVLIDEGKPVVITLEEIAVPDSSTGDYYYKKLTGTITISIKHTSAKGLIIPTINNRNVKVENNGYTVFITVKNNRVIDISGKVWLDGQTGIKPVVGPNGKYDNGETLLKGITVTLCDERGNSKEETTTDAKGQYSFENVLLGNYKVKFTYDGINYEDTKYYKNSNGQIVGNSKAQENSNERNTFNARFKTIKYQRSNDGTPLSYIYNENDKKSTLETRINGVNPASGGEDDPLNFKMSAYSELIKTTIEDINLGLVKKGTDLALSTDVANAEVTINGQKTNYEYNKENGNIEIGTKQANEQVEYNLNIYSSDYNYRIRDYINNQTFTEKNYMKPEKAETFKSGDELKVYVIYKVNLQNQSTETAYVNNVEYKYDSKYTFNEELTKTYNENHKGIVLEEGSFNSQDNNMDINLRRENNLYGVELKDGQTKTLYLVFEVNKVDNNISLGDFSNKAEITSYSTETGGLIDCDSQPGNHQPEDDSDEAAGLNINTNDNSLTRTIEGKVVDGRDNNKLINDVIVQLIELKAYKGKTYEYIWEETRTGSGTGKKLSNDGKALENYSYEKVDGQYQFTGFIPGDYIVRFIYGDGKTYDLTNNVIKYNGQDYKTAKDSKYQEEWYNPVNYGEENVSVARDNEARRLETMAYGVRVDGQKGVLLKLLDASTVDKLNTTEKQLVISAYNNLYDPDIKEIDNNVLQKLLKEQVLPNTWMCAETSKIHVAVDKENWTKTANTTVNGKEQSKYIQAINNINLGLEKRPETQITLEKHITGFKLTANNGQTLVNTYVDISKYLDSNVSISDVIEGIRDGLSAINGSDWTYEVNPTEINTIVDGAKLEFVYTYVVKNDSDVDYLSAKLLQEYNENNTEDYIKLLKEYSKTIKKDMRLSPYTNVNGTYLSTTYYTGNVNDEAGQIQTEVTSIRDYVNNDLTFMSGTKVVKDEEASGSTHNILKDDYSLQEVKINTILKTAEATGKMKTGDTVTKYAVTLGKDPLSATGTLNFENYIAEVMEYTNAAGRRATSTPENAEIIVKELRDGKAHESDEAVLEDINIGAGTGEDEQTNYILLISIIAGVMVIIAGVVITKKYIIK